ncbi:unnamed protein product [Leptidea sinapis]|uniref:Uncharacterized protein n=1 Tax=Leptidea sinapis TaxID=189913 RepID=A0A5E4QJG4_9NEOP|nr:unnamed protein product [Leptidea sinapis]
MENYDIMRDFRSSHKENDIRKQMQLQSSLTGSDFVEIKLTIIDICWTRQRVIVPPVGAGLCLLVEQSTRRTEEPEVSYSTAGDSYAHMKRLAARFSISVRNQ